MKFEVGWGFYQKVLLEKVKKKKETLAKDVGTLAATQTEHEQERSP